MRAPVSASPVAKEAEASSAVRKEPWPRRLRRGLTYGFGDMLDGTAPPPDPSHRTRLFHPFGLGMLDLAVGALVYRLAGEQGLGTVVPSFIPTPWRTP